MLVLADLPEKFKKKLQIFVERKDLSLPVYHVEREDPRAPCVKATVSVGEDCFVSQGLYKTSEEAEDAAAQIALLSLSTEALQEVKLKSVYCTKNMMFVPEMLRNFYFF